MQQQQQHIVALPEDRRCKRTNERIVFNMPLTDSRTRALDQSNSQPSPKTVRQKVELELELGSAAHSIDRQTAGQTGTLTMPKQMQLGLGQAQ